MTCVPVQRCAGWRTCHARVDICKMGNSVSSWVVLISASRLTDSSMAPWQNSDLSAHLALSTSKTHAYAKISLKKISVWSENYMYFSYFWDSLALFLTITASNGHDVNRAQKVVFRELQLCSSWSKVCKQKQCILLGLLLLQEETLCALCALNVFWISFVYFSLSTNHAFLMSDVI